MEMTRFEKLFVNRVDRGRRNAARVRLAVERLGPVRITNVLEIGCGIGTASATLADEFGWNIVGTDYDPLQIEEAKGRYPESGGLRFQREDAERLSFADDTFDFAYAQYVFHHIPGWRGAIREIARVLRPGGVFYWRDFVVPRSARALLPLVHMSDSCVRDYNRKHFLTAGFTLEHEHRGVVVDECVHRLKSALD